MAKSWILAQWITIDPNHLIMLNVNNSDNRTWTRNWLNLSWRRSMSYRNQYTDLLSKSTGWFLYNRDLCHELMVTLNALKTLLHRFHEIIWPLWVVIGSKNCYWVKCSFKKLYLEIRKAKPIRTVWKKSWKYKTTVKSWILAQWITIDPNNLIMLNVNDSDNRTWTWLNLSWRRSYHIETSPLICSANQ